MCVDLGVVPRKALCLHVGSGEVSGASGFGPRSHIDRGDRGQTRPDVTARHDSRTPYGRRAGGGGRIMWGLSPLYGADWVSGGPGRPLSGDEWLQF